MTLLFYDFDFNFLCAEPKITSSRWTLYYNDIGTFEAHIPLSSDVLKIISDNKYIVVREGKKTALIVGIEISDEAVIYGRTCNWLLTKRVISASGTKTGDAGTVSRELVLNAFNDVDNFLAEVWEDTGSTITTEISAPEILSDVVVRCLNMKGLGHCVDFDTSQKKWIFKILKGGENSLIISESNKNAYDTVISGDILDAATCGYYMQSSNGSDSIAYVDGDGADGIYRWEAILSGNNENDAKADLAECKEKNSTTLFTRNIALNTDYELGDTVRIQITKGCLRTTKKRRIIGTELRCSADGVTEQPIFEKLMGGSNGI